MAEHSHTVLFYEIKQKVRDIFAYFGGRSMKMVNFKDYFKYNTLILMNARMVYLTSQIYKILERVLLKQRPCLKY